MLQTNTKTEERIKKKKDPDSFKLSIGNLKESVTYIEYENYISKEVENGEISSTFKNYIDIFVNIAKTSTAVSLSVTIFSSILKPVLTGLDCGLTVTDTVLYNIIQKQNIGKSFDESARLIIRFF